MTELGGFRDSDLIHVFINTLTRVIIIRLFCKLFHSSNVAFSLPLDWIDAILQLLNHDRVIIKLMNMFSHKGISGLSYKLTVYTMRSGLSFIS